jgi:hypothetical protein
MCAEGVLIILCAWAQLTSTKADAWTRAVVVLAFVLAMYLGVDLNDARDAQLAFDKTTALSAEYASNGTPGSMPGKHHHRAKNPH